MKRTAVLSVALMLVLMGAAGAASTTVSYKVSAGGDDGFAVSSAGQDTTAGYLWVGDDNVYMPPYYMSAMRFVDLAIPRSATITSAYLKVSSIDQEYRGRVYGVIEGEAADNPSDFSGRNISSATKTSSSVNWDHTDNWAASTQYVSGDISSVVSAVTVA